MQLNPKSITSQELQGILQTSVAPRPIALASTLDKDGNSNVSPFSFFNIFSTNPPILIFSPARRVRDNSIKHTLENVKEVAEVAIGVVNYALVQQVSLASTEYDKGVNEFIKAGLTEEKSVCIQPSIIAECPVNFECKVIEIKELGQEGGAGNLVICEIVHIHIHDSILNEEGKISQDKIDLVGRLGGDLYCRTFPNALFTVPKPLVKKGIGFDNLPKEILHSVVFTGNDLGMLANIESLPIGHFTSDCELHKRAKILLQQNKIEQAWQLLISI